MKRAGYRRHKGTVLVLVAILLVVLLGMMALAVDISRLYVARQFLVTSCDASALAGGMELPDQGKATDKASECAGANTMVTYQVSFPEEGFTEQGATRIRVDGQLNVQYCFANILGFSSRTVGAHAVVERGGMIGWVNGNVVPWGMPFFDQYGNPYDYNNGVLYTLKVGSQSDLADGTVEKVGGNFYPLAIERSLGDGSSGGSVYNECIKWGFNGQIEVGDTISTEPGNMVGPTKQAVSSDPDSLFARAAEDPWADDTWDNYDYGNPRIVIVPIISPLTNGRTDVQVLGFAAFYVESVQGQEVKGYFINYTVPEAGGDGPDYGLTTFRLVE
ncbi:MAG: Tad domain-containing protein [Armatimonadota bacterium]